MTAKSPSLTTEHGMGHGSVMEPLLSKQKSLSSNPTTTKKSIEHKLDFIKITNFWSSKPMLCEKENKPQTRNKYLHISDLIKDLYSDYIKNSQNILRMQLKNWQKSRTDMGK
jgi:hypothetical protein